MKNWKFISILLPYAIVFWACTPLLGADLSDPLENSQTVSFFHPTGMNGFIIYDGDANDPQSEFSYGKQSYDLSYPLGLPVKVDVEGFNLSERTGDVQKLLKSSESHYLEIFSIRHALAYGSKSLLSPYHPGKSDITMVVASANYQASERFSAKLSTAFTQSVQEKKESSSNIGYELDIAGLYEVAPGLTFSVGAGYTTQMDRSDPVENSKEESRFWSLTSKLRLRF